MTKDEVMKPISEHWEEIKRFSVKSLAIFGSVARGEARPDSDIDILVEFDGRPTFDAYMDLKLFLEELLGRKVDLVTRKALKPRLKPHVEKEAIYAP